MKKDQIISDLLLPKYLALTGEAATIATPLIGSGAKIDSVQLVSFLLDVEDGVKEKFGKKIRIISENALSQKNSPFLHITSFAEYVETLLEETA